MRLHHGTFLGIYYVPVLAERVQTLDQDQIYYNTIVIPVSMKAVKHLNEIDLKTVAMEGEAGACWTTMTLWYLK